MEILVIALCALAVVGMLLLLALKPELHLGKITLSTFWLTPFLIAVILLATGLEKWDYFVSFLTSPTAINPLEILLLFFSMAFISIVLDEAGFFAYLASKTVSVAKGSQFAVFTLLYLLTSFLTVFTSNDIIILTFTPFLIYFSKEAKVNPVPYLVGEFVAANSWSLLFLIGNPTNIYLSGSFNLSFAQYFLKMWPSTLFAGIASFSIMILLFHQQLLVPFSATPSVSPIKDKPLMVASLTTLLVCLLLMVISSFIALPLWAISACSALALLLFCFFYALFKKKVWPSLGDSLKRLPFEVAPFVLSMFVLVLALKSAGITGKIGSFLNSGDSIWTYGFASFFSANFINNIPMSVLFSEVIKDSGGNLNAVYASIIGSNLGAFLSPVGALAGVMWMSILKNHGIKFTFFDFLKYGSLIAIPSLALSLLGLCL